MANLQIRDMDDELHDRLRARAAAVHRSMRDHVLGLIEQDLARPSLAEWLDDLLTLPVLDVDMDTAALVRAEREARTDQVLAGDERATYADGA